MPKLVEVNVSASQGGGVQIVDFGKLKTDFHLSESERWDVSDLKTQASIDNFVAERRKALCDKLDELTQQEFAWRFAERDKHLDGEQTRWENNG